MKEVYPTSLEAVLEDQGVDGVLIIAIAPELPRFEFLDVSGEVNRVMPEGCPKPVVTWLYGPNRAVVGAGFERPNRITHYWNIEEAVWALSLLRRRGRFIDKSIQA